MSQLSLTLMVTGSTSIRLLWTDLAGVTAYKVFRATTNVQPGSPLTTVLAGAQVYNDHGDDLTPKGLHAGTDYYYWVADQNNALIAGPLKATTAEAAAKGPLYRAIQDALQAWGAGVTGYDADEGVFWADQPPSKPAPPFVMLELSGPISQGMTASQESDNEALGNMQQWVVSVQIFTGVPDVAGTITDAMQVANDLSSSLDDPSVTAALSAAGIGVADRHPAMNLSKPLETGFERRAAFDFDINVRNVYPVTVPGTIDNMTPPIANVAF